MEEKNAKRRRHKDTFGLRRIGNIQQGRQAYQRQGGIKSIAVMHDRSNGLGGGFAAYGIYPEYKDFYALHIFYDNENAKAECENFLLNGLEIAEMSEIPTLPHKNIKDAPLIWRYFAKPKKKFL
jgi:glutamate synthase domain-containing protein 1